MNAQSIRLATAAALVASSLALGCRNDPAPTAVTPAPTASQPGIVATATPNPQLSLGTSGTPAPAGPTSAPTSAPGAEPTPFRDEFTDINGQPNPATWAVYEQSGIVRELDGTLELLSTGTAPNFPYLLTKNPIIPATGPWFFEFSYKLFTLGAQVSFSLDYLPAPAPDKRALTAPFMYTNWLYKDLRMVFDLDGGLLRIDGTNGNVPGVFHRVRLEGNDAGQVRVIVDKLEVGSFDTPHRPSKFWVGTNPPKSSNVPAGYPRIALDYVTAGRLTTPDPATPPSPPASPTPTP